MKKGCLLSLFILIGGFFGYSYLLKGTDLESKVWVPALLALGAAIVFANLFGIVQALAQARAAKRPRSEWRDGDLVAVSGPIHPLRAAVTAPFSGSAAAIVEYTIKRASTGESTNSINDYQGFLMTACGVYSSDGIVRIIGFPLLGENMSTVVPSDPVVLRRAAEYLSQCKFMQQASNPIKALKQLAEVLSDDDGVVRADFCKGGSAHLIDDDVEVESEDEVDTAAGQLQPSAETPTVKDPITAISEALSDYAYVFEEKLIRAGEEVTAIGTYYASKQSIDIGSGLKKLAHSLQRGAVTQVTARNLRRSVIASLFWGAVVAAGNWYVLVSIGLLDPP